jgi:hypothetical protein
MSPSPTGPEIESITRSRATNHSIHRSLLVATAREIAKGSDAV